MHTQRKGLYRQTEKAVKTLNLDFQASRTMKTKCPLLKPSSLWCFAMVALMIKIHLDGALTTLSTVTFTLCSHGYWAIEKLRVLDSEMWRHTKRCQGTCSSCGAGGKHWTLKPAPHPALLPRSRCSCVENQPP